MTPKPKRENEAYLNSPNQNSSREYHPRRNTLLLSPRHQTALSVAILSLTRIISVVAIFKRPRPIMDTPQSTTLKRILDCSDSVCISRLEEWLPSLLKMAGEDVVWEEICEDHRGDDCGGDGVGLVDYWENPPSIEINGRCISVWGWDQ